MPNLFTISNLLPLKFYQQADVFGTEGYSFAAYKSFDPNQNERGMDADFFYRNIKSYMDKVRYWQPYQQGDKLTLQWLGVEDYALPLVNYVVKILDCNGKVVKQQNAIEGQEIGTGSGVFIRSCNMTLYNVPEGKYIVQLHKIGIFGDYDFFVISEPIWIKAHWPNTMLLRYSHSSNAYGIYFETGIELWKRVYANFTEINPGSKFKVYEDQPLNLQLLSGVKFRDKELTIGVDNNFNPEYEIDKLEEILLCDTLYIDHILHTRNEGSKFEIQRTDKSPIVQASISMREKINDTDLVVSQYPPVVIADAPTSEWFSVRNMVQTTPALSYTINSYFNGAVNFVNFLNSFIGYVDYVNTYFAIDALNRIVLITNDSAVYTGASSGLTFNDVLESHLIIEVQPFGTDLDLQVEYVNATATTKYRYFWGDGTSVNGSATSATQTKTYTAGVNRKAFIFWDLAEEIYLSNSELIIHSLEGKLPQETTIFECNNNVVMYVKNDLVQNLFGTCVALDLSANRLRRYDINDIIRHCFENINGFDPSATITLDNQTPAAPPHLDEGTAGFISQLNAAGITVMID